MKILSVNMSLDPVTGGGTAERTRQLTRALAAAGHSCYLVATDVGITEKVREELSLVHTVFLPCLCKRFYIPRFSFQQICRLVSEVDIVHLMGHWTLINVIVYFAALRYGKPYVVSPAGALPLYGRSRLFKRVYNLLFGTRMIRNANGFVAITGDEIRQFAPYGVDSTRVKVIANGINSEDFADADSDAFRVKHGLADAPYVLFVGRLNHIKGPDILVDAFCQLADQFPKHHLVMAGPDGGMLGDLKGTVASHGLQDRVHFLGYLGGTDKSQAYHAAQLLVIPSRQEAMSIVVLESGISGTAVLITDQCGFDEVERIGGGLVVKASVDGVREGMVKLLSAPGELKAMGARLRLQVGENYTWQMSAEKHVVLFQELV